MYAIAVRDWHMSNGKLAAQCGHAFVNALDRAPPIRKEEYHKDGIGTKVCLEASLERILDIHQRCNDLGIPNALIIDSGHVLPPHFTGEPIITALGIGPVYRHEVPFLRKLQLIK